MFHNAIKLFIRLLRAVVGRHPRNDEADTCDNHTRGGKTHIVIHLVRKYTIVNCAEEVSEV